MRGIAVAFGERVVLLPESGDVLFFERWSRADAITRLSNGVTLNGRLVPWPTEPQHVLDRADL
ncbi:MAG TPA: hypothetical protein VNA20_15975 [Frankiaceae bacterium]|nr:hypothetical protein [Frankiaceae bacterium]